MVYESPREISLCGSIFVAIDADPELGTVGHSASCVQTARSCRSYVVPPSFVTLSVHPLQNEYASALLGCSRGAILHTPLGPFDPQNWVLRRPLSLWDLCLQNLN